MQLVRVVVEGRNQLVGDRIYLAHNTWNRFRGLMGTRGLPQGSGMLFPRTNAVHGFFMRYPLTLVYLDRESRVLVCTRLKPWRIGPIVPKACFVLELPPCWAEQIMVGDRLSWT